jgi:membrane associated rhomboid family serine protease
VEKKPAPFLLMNFFSKIAETFRQQGRLAQLLIINVAVFLTINIGQHIAHIDLVPYLGLPIGGADFLYKIWTLFTYMFSHESLGHVFFNMLLFYFSAQLFFLILGEGKLVYVYVMSGLVGGAFLLLCGIVFPASFSNSILIGASAAVMGVVMVMAVYAPNFTVNLWGIIHMPYKYFAMLTFLLSTVIDFSLNTGGKISHIGGAAFGLAYGLCLKRGKDIFDFTFFRRKKLKVMKAGPPRFNDIDDSYNESRLINEKRMNELLDKISRSGYDSLTRKEKEELFRLSQKK